MTYRLVALALGGEMFLSRDSTGTWRRHERYVPGVPEVISAEDGERAISIYGFTRVGEDFESWQALAKRASELVRRVSEPPPISTTLVRAVLPELQDRKRLHGTPTDDVVRLVGSFLARDEIINDTELRTALTELLSQRVAPPSPVSTGTRLSRMRGYFEPLAVAA